MLRQTFTGSERISYHAGRNDSFWTMLRFYMGQRVIFTMTILFSWKSGRAILHHKSESFNYGTDNDDKRYVCDIGHRKEGICSAICISA